SLRGRLHPESLDAVNEPTYIQDVVEKDEVFRAARRGGEGLPRDEASEINEAAQSAIGPQPTNVPRAGRESRSPGGWRYAPFPAADLRGVAGALVPLGGSRPPARLQNA